jgi:GDP-L-fucose synthase
MARPTEPLFDLAGRRIFVAGHGGMVGAALCRRLAAEGCELVVAPRAAVDLRRQSQVEDWLAAARPEAIFLAAARVGGIQANDSRPGDFLYDNLMIEANVIEAAHRLGVAKLMFLGSSCIYPKLAPQPITEAALLTGPLEATNQWYAVAKIAGLKMCQAYRRQYGCNFIAVMPTNLYGPGDNFDPVTSHVFPALLRRIHAARESGAETVTVWGTGTPRRELLHVDDLADACVFVMKHYAQEEPLNIGTGSDVSIAELAGLVAEVVGYGGRFKFDSSKPDGTARKLLDITRLARLGWHPAIELAQGVRQTYAWYLQQLRISSVRGSAAAQEQPAVAAHP